MARDDSVDPKMESRVRTYVSANAERVSSVVDDISKPVERRSCVSDTDERRRLI